MNSNVRTYRNRVSHKLSTRTPLSAIVLTRMQQSSLVSDAHNTASCGDCVGYEGGAQDATSATLNRHTCGYELHAITHHAPCARCSARQTCCHEDRLVRQCWTRTGARLGQPHLLPLLCMLRQRQPAGNEVTVCRFGTCVNERTIVHAQLWCICQMRSLQLTAQRSSQTTHSSLSWKARTSAGENPATRTRHRKTPTGRSSRKMSNSVDGANAVNASLASRTGRGAVVHRESAGTRYTTSTWWRRCLTLSCTHTFRLTAWRLLAKITFHAGVVRTAVCAHRDTRSKFTILVNNSNTSSTAVGAQQKSVDLTFLPQLRPRHRQVARKSSTGASQTQERHRRLFLRSAYESRFLRGMGAGRQRHGCVRCETQSYRRKCGARRGLKPTLSQTRRNNNVVAVRKHLDRNDGAHGLATANNSK